MEYITREMKNFELFKPHSLLFAPLEGVTEEAYRLCVMRLFPEWDRFFTDFLRVPAQGKVTEKFVIEHLGPEVYANEKWRRKTSFQILTSPNARTQEVVEILNDLDIDHLDLNLGCPSNTVNSHQGGAYLLAKPTEMKQIVSLIRTHFKKTFTVKMRIGYRDDALFIDNIKMLQDLGVEAITLHARTKEQLYKGIADWNYIKKAVETLHIPVIGNGDIWSIDDIDRIFLETNCYGVMCGRSAMKTPWLATLRNEAQKNNRDFDETYLLYERKKYIEIYFLELLKEFRRRGWSDQSILKRFKSFSRYLFDDFENGETLRGQFLRSESLNHFLDSAYSL